MVCPSPRGRGPRSQTPHAIPFPNNNQEDENGPGIGLQVLQKTRLLHDLWQRSMEVVLSAAKCTATRFQMQASINADAPLPIPTPNERVHLMGAYDSSETRAYLNTYQYARLAKKMGVTATSVRKWFTDERMRQGYHTE